VSHTDLHIHTTASDGKFTPAEIVQMSAARGLTTIAITDHDTVDGIPAALEAAKAYPQLRVIPGVEINTDVSTGEAHLLGYFVDYQDAELLCTLNRLRDTRVGRAQRMIEKLAKLGVNIEWSRVRELAGEGSVGRPHIAQAMQEKGYIGSFHEAFDKYIGRGCPAYAEREKITPADAVELVLKANGLPVLGHPFTISNPEQFISELSAVGLVGVETYYNNYTPEQVNQLAEWADKYGLLTTGGTDFHGLDSFCDITLGVTPVPDFVVQRLRALAQERNLRMLNAGSN